MRINPPNVANVQLRTITVSEVDVPCASEHSKLKNFLCEFSTSKSASSSAEMQKKSYNPFCKLQSE